MNVYSIYFGGDISTSGAIGDSADITSSTGTINGSNAASASIANDLMLNPEDTTDRNIVLV